MYVMFNHYCEINSWYTTLVYCQFLVWLEYFATPASKTPAVGNFGYLVMVTLHIYIISNHCCFNHCSINSSVWFIHTYTGSYIGIGGPARPYRFHRLEARGQNSICHQVSCTFTITYNSSLSIGITTIMYLICMLYRVNQCAFATTCHYSK